MPGQISARTCPTSGCVSAGYTVEEVSANIHEAIEPHIASMLEHGEEIPPPSSQVVLVEVAS